MNKEKIELLEGFLESLNGCKVDIDVSMQLHIMRPFYFKCTQLSENDSYYILEDTEDDNDLFYLPKNEILNIEQDFKGMTITYNEITYSINKK